MMAPSYHLSLHHFLPVSGLLFSAAEVSTVLKVAPKCPAALPCAHLLSQVALCPLGAPGSPVCALWAAAWLPGQLNVGSYQGASETRLMLGFPEPLFFIMGSWSGVSGAVVAARSLPQVMAVTAASLTAESIARMHKAGSL